MNARQIVLAAGALIALAGCASRPAAAKSKVGATGRTTLAFSLREAQNRAHGKGPGEAQVRGIGGITRLVGCVADGDDLIVVGRAEPGFPALDASDLAVAMRAVLVNEQWPLVSIDRTPATRQTGLQTVRLEGVPARTSFARTMLEADVTLKKLALGLLSGNSCGIQPYFSMCAEQVKSRGGMQNVASRFWFYPVHPALAVREGVCVLTSADLAVVTEVLSVDGKAVGNKPVRDEIGDAFAAALSDRMTALAKRSPEVARLWSLVQMIALSRGMQLMPSRPDLHFWLHDYPVPAIDTPSTYPVLRNQTVITPNTKSRAVQSLRLQLEGGCELKAEAIRLREGDVTALRDLVRRSRPSHDSLVWAVPVEDWGQSAVSPASHVVDPDCGQNDAPACLIYRNVMPSGSTLLGPSSNFVPVRATPFPSFSITDHMPPPPLPRGGVKADVRPVTEGKGGDAIRDAARSSRPSNSSPVWDFQAPGANR